MLCVRIIRWPNLSVDFGCWISVCRSHVVPQVNGIYVCENNQTGNGLLKGYGGFRGWMCSDYDGTRSTIDAANHGLDIAMPGPPSRPDFFGKPLLAAVKSGLVSESVITDKAVRAVYSLAAVGALDNPNNGSSDADVTSPEHRALARTLAAASTTLLRNENGALPLSLSALAGKKGSVALVGLAGRDAPMYGGGGSGHVVPIAPVSIYDALASVLDANHPPSNPVTCTNDPNVDYFCGARKSVKVTSNGTTAGCCAACRATGDTWVAFTALSGSNQCWCHPDLSGCTKTAKTGFTSGKCSGGATESYTVAYDNGNNLETAAAVAKAADVAIVVLAQTSSEGKDRTNMTLPQSEVVSAVAAVQPNTIVITVSPGPFLTPWRNNVAAFLDMGFPGEQEGNAAVDVLFGTVNPRGKMPHTMPITANDQGFTEYQYPGTPPENPAIACSFTPQPMQPNGLNQQNGTGAPHCDPYAAHYNETLFVGYRWYDQFKVTPAYPFGHGLSYTTFSYSDLSVTQTEAKFTVTNTGSVNGTEVAQLYLTFPVEADEPPQQLKGFSAVELAAGASTTVTLPLTPRSFSVWSVASHAWTVVKGNFGVSVGSSSRDIRLRGSLSL